MAQRGIPRLSSWQEFVLMVLPAQQLAFSLHDVSDSRQIPPAGVHALPWVQRPIGLSPTLEQITLVASGRLAEPQQSSSVWQVSPVGRQPLGGWQMSTPVGP
jgi:hypothetical protein